MHKFARWILLFLLNSSFLYLVPLAKACEKSFQSQKDFKRISKTFNGQNSYSLKSDQAAKKFADDLQNNVFPFLERATTDQDVNVRLEALKGITQLSSQAFILVEKALNHSNKDVRQEALAVPLWLLHHVTIITLNKMRDPDVEVRNQAGQFVVFFQNGTLPLIEKAASIAVDTQDTQLKQDVIRFKAYVLSLANH